MMTDCQWDRTPKARKDHVCHECGHTIPKGMVYHLQTGIGDGEPYTWKAHQDCAELYWKINNSGGCYDDYTSLFDIGIGDLRQYRGLFPHVICRFEYAEQMRSLQ